MTASQNWLALGVVAAAVSTGWGARAASDAAALAPGDAAALIQVLERAQDEGLGPAADDRIALSRALESANPAEAAAARQRLIAEALAYARADHGLRMPTARFPRDWAIRPAPFDPEPSFATAAAAHRLPAWGAAQPPPDPRYAPLARIAARYRRIVEAGGWKPLRAPGKPASAVAPAALAERLAIEDAAVAGDLPGAIARADARYGLAVAEEPTAALIAALDVAAGVRLSQIDASLERLRWLPRNLPPGSAELNIADATFTLAQPGEPPLSMRAIVGRPDRPTPMMIDRIRAIIFNPPWIVPHDIAVKEIWPRIRRDPGYMSREGFIVRSDGSLEQKPGPRCALGALKFELSNAFDVYLHDTSAPALFSRSDRDLSHGCMRLADPRGLAERLLAGEPGWMSARIEAALASGATQRATLTTPVTVVVEYLTAFPLADGAVAFRADAYGWDARLIDQLRRPAG